MFAGELPENIITWVKAHLYEKFAETSEGFYSHTLEVYPDLKNDNEANAQLSSLIDSLVKSKASSSSSSSSSSSGSNIDVIRQKLDKVLFPTEADRKPVKTAGVYLITKDEGTGKLYILMGKMKKDNPKKPETHIFNGTYSGFSGKAEQGEGPFEAAVREFYEETGGMFGSMYKTAVLMAQDNTIVVKNAGWDKFPSATYIVGAKYVDYSQAYAELKNDQSEIQQINWVSLDSIWT
jgi:ADP-ribose pyrophosphatase YjhB (NUDIX family)